MGALANVDIQLAIRRQAAEDLARPAPLPSEDSDEPVLRRTVPEPKPKPELPPIAPEGEHEGTHGHRITQKTIAIGLAALACLALATAGYLYWDFARHFESTDDAFIEARQFTIAPKVPGYITAVAVTDNQHVNPGDVIAQLDDRDYRVALDQAEAQVATAQANIQNIDAQIAVQQAQVTANEAQVDQSAAALTFAQQQANRYKDLADRAVGTVQMEEQTASALKQDEAQLRNANAALTVAKRQIDSLQAQRRSAEASLAQANAQREQARLNLSYTTIEAAQAGKIADLTASVGQFAQAGTGLAMFVPDEIWVTANFKETQLNYMRPGQLVTAHVDAYSGRIVQGHIASIQPGSGTAFSLLPAQNATGNYVKIVQRVPVKIVLDNPPADVTLGPGMSVVPSVRVLPELSLYERR
jgi:membrane fusion protein (multidrug efflux system)